MAVANLYFSDAHHVRYLLDAVAARRPEDGRKSKLERELERALARVRCGGSRTELTGAELEELVTIVSAKPESSTKLAVLRTVRDGFDRAEVALEFERERSARVQRQIRGRA